jgi:hypothetical protein
MLTVHLTSDDLLNVRFAYSPLLEIPASYWVLQNPFQQAAHRRWVEEANHALYDAEFPFLEGLLPANRACIPRFLTPMPHAQRLNIDNEFEEVLETPQEAIREDVLSVIAFDGENEVRRYFLSHPYEAVVCLVDEMREYWQRTMAHHWTGMLAMLEQDVLYRARMVAIEGASAAFTDMGKVAYRSGQLHIQPTPMARQDDWDLHLEGQGVQLVPSVIAGFGRYLGIFPDAPLMLAYEARGTGLWMQPPERPKQSLELALGASRAQVLIGLRTPSSTTELALRLHVSAGSISQHLMRLAGAGLVESRRSGKRVYYHLTERGESLIALFDQMT